MRGFRCAQVILEICNACHSGVHGCVLNISNLIISMSYYNHIFHYMVGDMILVLGRWASYQKRKIAGLLMRRECQERSPRHRGLMIPTCIMARA